MQSSAKKRGPGDPGELGELGESLERWAEDYVTTCELAHKLAPPATSGLALEDSPEPRRIERPGRPPELRVIVKSGKTPRPGALERPEARARLLHTFLHHELQAAELMAWALLAFPEAPGAFKRGLVAIALDEIRHLGMYREHIESLGYRVGDFPVRDWFWERVPSCETPAQFVAVMGMGFEAGNLEHSSAFAARFRAVGDEAGALVQERVGAEEVAHVRFAAHWFERWTGGCEFAEWIEHLPAPLSPMLMRGKPLAREARRRAGISDEFLDELEAWTPVASGS